MEIIKRIPNWAGSIACVVIVFWGTLIFTPVINKAATGYISPSEIRVLDAGPYQQVRRPGVKDADISLIDQFRPRQTKPRQFSYSLEAPPSPDQRLVLYSPIIGGNASVSINGAPFARSQLQTFKGFNFGQAKIFALTEQRFFHPGVNRIDIILAEDTERTGLRALFFGDADALMMLNQRIVFWMGAIKSFGILSGIVSIICALLGLILGRHRLSYMGGVCLGGLLIIHSFPVKFMEPLTDPIVQASLILVSTSCIILGLLKKSAPFFWLVRGLALAAFIASIFDVYLTLSPGHIGSSLLMTGFSSTGLFPILTFGLPILITVDVASFRTALAKARADAANKDIIIQEKEAALTEKIQQQAILKERQRFTRDMHDGIGGQLLSLLVRVRSGRVSLDNVEHEIQSGINDLRLVVDSLDHVGDDISAALSTFQNRARAQLDAGNISLEWSQDTNLDMSAFDTRQVLHLYRFLQEAVSNILRHTSASKVHIKISNPSNQKSLDIRVEDNGDGMNAATDHAGKGLKNMEQRAQKLGGELKFLVPKTGSGTVINLLIPLKENNPPAPHKPSNI